MQLKALKSLYRQPCRSLWNACIRACIPPDHMAKRMERDWDVRARRNARHFVATGRADWSDEEFFASGEQTVTDCIRTDIENVCQSKHPAGMRVLEIGCGTGRVTMALARMFGEVHAVDVSGEMVRQARLALRGQPNAFVYQNNGMDLSVIPERPFDFAFSSLVFQHIPRYEIIRNYTREVNRLLAPGGLFKFQVRGNTADASGAADTWVGFAFSERQAEIMAQDCGFEIRYRAGAGTQDFWLWFFKSAYLSRPSAGGPDEIRSAAEKPALPKLYAT